ncbi:hypothetical protein SAY87_030691 [Trapa incisa]|uniref:xyloglucan:xyloglucosyl transferase n=1 Tax=Trapa incisa TaxID=236973 RepID=A0AAN7KS57_9MYRT|nr:hypothetical protein SAY87_030691 [Trapa incisa]
MSKSYGGDQRAKIQNGGRDLTSSSTRPLAPASLPRTIAKTKFTLLLSQFANRFLVDNIPIRVFSNLESIGVPFPKDQPMTIYSSIWNADNWATMGGHVKTNWTNAPFTASFRNFNANACIRTPGSSSCTRTDANQGGAWQDQTLDASGRNRIRWVQQKYMVCNYCTDVNRFPQGLPPECKRSRFL